MKLFKTTVEKIGDLGFKLVEQKQVNDHKIEEYQRYDNKHSYMQVIYISKKMNGRWYIQSYQKDINSDRYNNAVALCEDEMRLFLKRIKELK